MKVLIPGPLRCLTIDREVDAHGATLRELMADLDRRFPGSPNVSSTNTISCDLTHASS